MAENVRIPSYGKGDLKLLKNRLMIFECSLTCVEDFVTAFANSVIPNIVKLLSCSFPTISLSILPIHDESAKNPPSSIAFADKFKDFN